MSQNPNAFYVEIPSRIKLVTLATNLIQLKPIAIGTLIPPYNQSECGIAIGQYAGQTNQGQCAIAIGKESGRINQGTQAIAVGVQSAFISQGQESIAIGHFAGFGSQGNQAIAIGKEAGDEKQGIQAIAIGTEAGRVIQGSFAIAIGAFAGQNNQPQNSIILNASGSTFSVTEANALYIHPIRPESAEYVLYYNDISKEITKAPVPTGTIPGAINYGEYVHWDSNVGAWTVGSREISLGSNAGEFNQGSFGVALGHYAGYSGQQTGAISIGVFSGQDNQFPAAIAIGQSAGQISQGTYAIAIGAFAGQTNQPQSSIILNASGSTFSATEANALYVHPIRNATAPQALFYDPTSKEISYSVPTFSGPLALQTYTYAYFQARDAVLGKFMYTDCADKDAFYRLRVSSPTTLFEGSTIYDSNLVYFDNDLTANATITGPGSDACMTLSVNSSSTVNQYAARQSHYYGHYQPGKSYMAMFSFSFGPAVVGIVKRVGFYDVDANVLNANNPLNGILLEQSDSGLSWKVYQGTGSVQNAPQNDWNVDPLNGSGPSGFNLTSTKAEQNLLGFVDLEWLGVGRVRVGFFLNGIPVIVHTYNNAGFSVPFIKNPLLPIRFEIRKTIANANSGSMNAICCTILSEGGFEPIGIVRTFQSEQLVMSNVPSAQIKYILAIRLRSEYPRADLKPLSLEIVSDLTGGANIAYFSLYLWRPSSALVPTGTPPGGWSPVSSTLGGSGSFAEYLNADQSGATDLYDQMKNDAFGRSFLILEGAVNSTSKSQLNEVANALINAQSSVDRANRDIFLITINNNLSGNNVKYRALFTFREF